jgi:hypothetical protein
MTSFYTKISNTFINPICDNWEKFKGQTLYSQYNSGDVVLQYFSIDNLTEFKQQHHCKIFSTIPDRVSFTLITGKGVLLPHKDHGYQVALNYYINAGEDVTQFYNTVTPEVSGITYPGRKQSNIFDEKDLIKTDNFIASSNELCLLNVAEIHSVIKTSDAPRVFISYSWNNLTYNELLTDIQSHNE